MYDKGAAETDRLITELEDRIRVEYGQAEREIEEKLKKYLQAFKTKDSIWQRWVSEGIRTEQEYREWKVGQIAIGERWEEMRQTIAEDLLNANKIALSIARGYCADAYALNHDYGTYQIEHDSLIDTSYTLYNRATAERVLRGNIQMLPGPGKKVSQDIRDGKAIRWNNQHIQSVMLQALLQGNSIPDIATRLANAVGDSGRKTATRNARTMMTNAQNTGRLDSFKRAEGMGIPVRKQWVATLDRRTRHEHRMLDGMVQDLDKPFKVEGMEIMKPGDPNAPPQLVYNCRCTLIGSLKGHERDLTNTDLRHNKNLGDMTYDEWREGKAISKPILSQEQTSDSIRARYIRQYRGYGGPVQSGRDMTLDIDFKHVQPKPKTFADKIGEIQARVQANGGALRESDILEAGKILAQEYEAYKADAKERMEQAQRALDKFLSSSGYTEAHEKYIGYARRHGWFSEFPDDIKEAERKANAIESTDEWKKLNRELRAAQKAYKGDTTENAEWLKGRLSEVREMGADGVNLKSHLNNSRSPARKYVERAYDIYPTDWVKGSVARGDLTPGMTDRGYYSDRMREIKISGSDDDSKFETAVHELGHRFERAVPGIRESEKEFYDRRTAGEQLEWLGRPYARSEVSRKDNFIHPYMGKDYGGSAYELVSMGFEYAYTNPNKLAEDKDMEAWIYGLLCLR